MVCIECKEEKERGTIDLVGGLFTCHDCKIEKGRDSLQRDLLEAAKHASVILDILKESPEIFTREMQHEKCIRDLEDAIKKAEEEGES